MRMEPTSLNKRGRSFWLVSALSFALLLAFAGSAYAAVGTAHYLTWASVAGLPGQGTSPHSGFTTGTQKCAVCHSVHGASDMGEVLLRSDVAGACNYCHVNTASAPISQVYESDQTKYSGTDYPNAHNYFTVLGVQAGVSCSTCHQVHAADNAMTDNEYLTQKLLRGAKTQNGTYDPIAGAPVSGEESNTALTKWCARCHFTGLETAYPYYRDDYNAASHVMTSAAAVYDNSQTNYNGRVAWLSSNNCSSCHSSGYTTSAWPHYTAGVRFLVTGDNASSTPNAATNGSVDGVCLRCHRDNVGNGIGLGF